MTQAQWYIARGGKQVGPFDAAAMKQMVGAGKLKPNDFVWKEGLKDWIPARQIKGLFSPDSPSASGSTQAGSAPASPSTRAPQRTAAGPPRADAPARAAATGTPGAAAAARRQRELAALANASGAVQAQEGYRSPTARAYRRSMPATGLFGGGSEVIVPFFCGIALAATIIVPWAVGRGGVAFSWDLFKRAPGSFIAVLIMGWIVGIAAIVVAPATRGLVRNIILASLGMVGLIALLMFVTGGGLMGGGRVGGGEKALAVFSGIFLITAIIITHLRLRSRSLAIRIIQAVAGGGMALTNVITLIVTLADLDHMGTAEAIVGIVVVVGFLTAGVLILLHGVGVGRGTRSLSIAGLAVLYGDLIGLYIVGTVAGIADHGQWGLILTAVNIGFLIGGLLFLFCFSVIGLVDGLSRIGAQAAPAHAGAMGGGAGASATVSATGDELQSKFMQLKQLLEQGHITQAEYDQKRAKLLDQM